MKGTWAKITLSLMLIAGVGVGVWAVIDKLDDATFKVIVGFVGALLAFVVIGGLFVAKDLVQAYLIRRAVQEDDLSDMRQMAFITRLMPGAGGAGRVNVTLPPGQSTPMLPFGQGWQQQPFDGAYRDAVIDGKVEVE